MIFSCFVSVGDDNHAWSLTFWFIPVGVSLIFGVLLFTLALVRITILLITIRKMTKLVLLYLRLFVFILVYLVLIVFITAYYIQYARDEGSINDGYAQYYQCLSYGDPNCSLDETITNYNLVMLKSFAISSLGWLLFFVFFSWDVIKFWIDIFKSAYFMLKTRKKSYAVVLLYKFAYSSTTRSISGKLSGGSEMTVTVPEGEAMDDLDNDSVEDDEGRTTSKGDDDPMRSHEVRDEVVEQDASTSSLSSE